MSTRIQTAFRVTFALWSALEASVALREAPTEARHEEHSSRGPLLLAMAASVGLGFALPHLSPATRNRRTKHPAAGGTTGLGLMLAGILLRLWAIKTLGRFFTIEVSAFPDHRVIREGPYRYVRHPGYSGTLLTLAGFGLVQDGPVGLLTTTAVGLWGLVRRAKAEERLLAANLEDYDEYAREIRRRFIPTLF